MNNWLGLERLAFEIMLESPLRIGGSGVDVRRNHMDRPCIPASTLKGRARLEAVRLCWTLAWPTCDFAGQSPCKPGASAICPICTLFGGRGIEGQITFTDSVADRDPVLTPLMRRVGTTVLALPIGTRCTGAIRHRIPSAHFRHLALVIAALSAIDHLGSQAAIGWGSCRLRFTTPGLDPQMIQRALWKVEDETGKR